MCDAKVMDCGVSQMYDLPVEGCASGVMGRDCWEKREAPIGKLLGKCDVGQECFGRRVGPLMLWLGKIRYDILREVIP